MKTTWACVVVALGSAACDPVPAMTVKVKLIEPCDQSSMANVGTIQLTVVQPDGSTKTTNASKSSGSARVSQAPISDGALVFADGYEGDISTDRSALDRPSIASGASAPVNLATHQQQNRFPAARQYPGGTGLPPWAGSGESVTIVMGRVNGFASTTTVSDRTCSQQSSPRHGHTATYLGESGKVALIGGLTYSESDGTETFVPKERAIEVYDPLSGTYSAANIDPQWLPVMQRAFHSATALPDGSLLVWGGIGPEGDGTRVSPRAISFVMAISSNGEVQVRTLAAAQGFSIKRFHHQATLTNSGASVVMTGGCGCIGGTLSATQIKAGMCPPVGQACTDGQPRVAEVEAYDVGTSNITQVSTNLFKARAFHNAVALEDEYVIIVGGDDGVSPVRDVEVFQGGGQPRLLSPPQDSLDVGAVTHAASVALNAADCAALLSAHTGGECVLVTGGCLAPLTYAGSPPTGACSDVRSTTTVLDFDPSLPGGSRRNDGPTLLRARYDHAAFNLPTGRSMVMLAGGRFALDGGPGTSPDAPPVSAELLLRAGPAPVSRFEVAAYMLEPRLRFGSAALPGGQILFTGGVLSISDGTAHSLATGEVFYFQSR